MRARIDQAKTPAERFDAAMQAGFIRADELKEMKRDQKRIQNPRTPKTERDRLIEKLTQRQEKQANAIGRMRAVMLRRGFDLTAIADALAGLTPEEATIRHATVQTAVRAMNEMHTLNSSWGDMAFEYWVNSLLSGPKTHVVNFTSNMAYMAWDLGVQRPVEALVNTMAGKEGAAQWGELPHMYKALVPAFRAALKNTMLAWSIEKPVLTYEHGQAQGNKGVQFDTSHGPAVGGRTGRVQWPFWGLRGSTTTIPPPATWSG